jgi:hypothetical protein
MTRREWLCIVLALGCLGIISERAYGLAYDWALSVIDNGGKQSALALYEHAPPQPTAGGVNALNDGPTPQVVVEARFLTVDPDTGNLDFHSFETGSGWSQSTVDASGNIGTFDLALCPFGVPHVAYTNSMSLSSLYATRVLDSWTSQQVAQFVDAALRPSIGVFPTGEVLMTSVSPDNIQIDALLAGTREHLAATVLSAPKLTCLNNQTAFINTITQQNYLHAYGRDPGSGDWYDEPVEATGKDIGLFTRIVVAPALSDDRRFVTLTIHPQAGEVIEVYGPGGSFVAVDNTDVPDTPLMAIDLAADNEGHLYLAWCSDDAVGITYEGASWHTEIVDDNFLYDGGNIEIEVDSLGGVHLTYFDANEDALVYAAGTPIPEPATLTMVATVVGTLAALRRRRRSRLRE